jgi:hypothetical protein
LNFTRNRFPERNYNKKAILCNEIPEKTAQGSSKQGQERILNFYTELIELKSFPLVYSFWSYFEFFSS